MSSPSRTPVLVLSLIGATLCLSIGAISLIVLFNANRPDSATIAAACKGEVGAAIKAESDKVAAACTANALPTTKSVPAVGGYPGFTYPSDWAVAVTNDNSNMAGTSLFAVHVTDTFYDPKVMGMDRVTIEIHSKDEAAVTKAGSFENFVKANLANTEDPNAKMSKETVNGREAIRTDFTINGPGSGDYEDLYFEGKNTYAVVEIFWGTMTGGDKELIDAYKTKIELIKNSLDLSSALD